MKNKKEKITRRLLAAFMLGVSLFSPGITKGNKKAETLRQSRNIHKREDINKESQEISQIAEEEAGIVLNEKSEKKEIQKRTEQKKSLFSRAFLYRSLFVLYIITAGIIFASVVFNQPFQFKKGFLSALPGNPHLATIDLTLDEQPDFFKTGDKLMIESRLNTEGSVANFVKVVIRYDPEVLTFDNYKIEEDLFDVVEKKEIDLERGRISLFLKNSKGVEVEDNKIFTLSFLIAKSSGKVQVDIDQEASLVLKEEKNEEVVNILGRTSGINFEMSKIISQELICSEFDSGTKIDNQFWEGLRNGTPFSGTKNNWIEINDQVAFVCGFNEEKIYFLFLADSPLKSVNFSQNTKNKDDQSEEQKVVDFKEKREEHGYYLLQTDFKIDSKILSNFSLQLKRAEGDDLIWP